MRNDLENMKVYQAKILKYLKPNTKTHVLMTRHHLQEEENLGFLIGKITTKTHEFNQKY